jgi:hypothetical protein
VGQTLTIVLQIETLAPDVPRELDEAIDDQRETASSAAKDVQRIAKLLRPGWRSSADLSRRRPCQGSAARRLLGHADGPTPPPGAMAASNGIRGMRARAMLIGGRIDIGPAAGGGTRTTLEVPTGQTDDLAQDPHPRRRRPPDRPVRPGPGTRHPILVPCRAAMRASRFSNRGGGRALGTRDRVELTRYGLRRGLLMP